MQEDFLVRNGQNWLFNACGARTKNFNGGGWDQWTGGLLGPLFPERMLHRQASPEVITSALLSNKHPLSPNTFGECAPYTVGHKGNKARKRRTLDSATQYGMSKCYSIWLVTGLSYPVSVPVSVRLVEGKFNPGEKVAKELTGQTIGKIYFKRLSNSRVWEVPTESLSQSCSSCVCWAVPRHPFSYTRFKGLTFHRTTLPCKS